MVVCTRNRPQEVERLLESLSKLSYVPTLIVVDASDTSATAGVVRRYQGMIPCASVRYMRAAPGVTRQRMKGVEALPTETDVVHFLDDDVVLQDGYFEELERCFALDTRVLGAGPVMDSAIRRPANWHDRLFLRDSNRGGCVLASGVNVLPRTVRGRMEVDWLSGCGMSYRTSVFRRIRFDETLEGYCLGEDVDFSYRVGQLGKLVVTSDAHLEHWQSAIDRLTADAWTRQAVVWRHSFVTKMRSAGLSIAAFWWSIAGELLFSGSFHGLRVSRDGLSHVAAVALGARDAMRARSHVMRRRDHRD